MLNFRVDRWIIDLGAKRPTVARGRSSLRDLFKRSSVLFILCHISIDIFDIFFFLEKVRAKYIFYFKLLRDSPIDQIVQTVFGYSLRKK